MTVLSAIHVLNRASDSTIQPNSLAGLIVWLDSETNVTTGTGGISAITDRSSAGNSVSQGTTGVRPALTTNVFKGGTKPSINFTQANNDFLLFGTPVTVASGGYTYFITVKPTNLTAGVSIYNYLANNSNGGGFLQISSPVSNINALLVDQGLVANVRGTVAITNTITTIAGTVDASGNANLYVNGAADGSTTGFSPSLTSDPEFGLTTLGYSPSTNTIDGHVAEVLIYSNGKTAAEIASLHAYAVSRWF